MNNDHLLINANALHPATPEEIATAAKSSAQLLEEAHQAGANKNPVAGNEIDVDLRKALGRYGKVKFAKFTAAKMYECRNLLQTEDPFLLALYFNVAFRDVARLANNILKERCEAEGRKVEQMPEHLPAYLKIVERMNIDLIRQLEAASTPIGPGPGGV